MAVAVPLPMTDPDSPERLARRERVLVLLRSWLDWLPALPTATGRLQQVATQPGPAPSKMRCGLCATGGRVLGQGEKTRACQACRAHPGRHGCRQCPGCEGTGWRKARRGDPLAEDPMLNPGANELVDEAERRSDKRLRAYAEELRLEALFVLREGESDPDWWLARAIRKQERLWALGSYRELGWCLAQLAEAWPRRSSLVWRHLIYAEEVVRSERVERVLAETLDWLAERMPAEIRVPEHLKPEAGAQRQKLGLAQTRSQAASELRAQRDEHIRRQRELLAWPVEQIAKVNAVTPRRVWQILGFAPSMASGPVAA